MELGISNKTAFITGGAGALGLSISRELAQEGSNIVVCDKNREALDRAIGVLKDDGHMTIGICADVTNKEEVFTAVARAESQFGGIDILVNNAGFARDSYLTRMPEEDWHSVIDVVIQGAYYCSRAILPGMMERKFGRIINISSRAHRGNPGQTNYSTAKAGLLGFTRSLALESGRFGITANAIAPGIISTPRMQERRDYEELTRRAKRNTPVARLGLPRDVATMVAYLASDLAGFITAETIHITGGRA